MSETYDLPTELQPPMENGEVVFEAPWQSRVFGMAVALSERGLFTWPEFQAELIRFVGQWDAAQADSQYQYFDHFSDALVATLSAKGAVDVGELSELMTALKSRPHGHDHDHAH